MAQVQYNNSILEFSDEFSRKDFTGKKVNIPDNTVVYQSCFSREKPDSIVFREDMTGVQFFNCNLDNCLIPDGNTVVDCSIQRFQVQDDGNDWLVDDNNIPVEPLNAELPVEEIAPDDVESLAKIETPQIVTLNDKVVGRWEFIKE